MFSCLDAGEDAEEDHTAGKAGEELFRGVLIRCDSAQAWMLIYLLHIETDSSGTSPSVGSEP